MILGSHVSIQGGYFNAVKRAIDVGCECLQIFTSAPGRWVVTQQPASEVKLVHRKTMQRTSLALGLEGFPRPLVSI
jgi:endonuclease IV